jgi:UDP:flavonoid glycosyltransferase YjiC (YdhE family)
MNIVIATIGSRGDVQPYINLAQGLRDAGHDVTLATNPTLCALVEQHGVRAAPVGSPVDMGMEGERLLEKSFDNMWIGMIRVMQLGGRLIEEAFPDVLAICEQADLVVTSDTGSGVVEAEKLGKPWISITLQPARLPLVPAEKPTLLAKLFGLTLGKLFIGPTNRFRKKVGAPMVADITSMLSSRCILLPVNRHVAPPNPQWMPQILQTNYWYARPNPAWTPPRDLLDFLNAGEKPVAITLGVMGAAKARQTAQVVVEAVQQAGVRAIIQGWGEVLRQMVIPSSVYSAAAMPHDWLFDQVSAVIHHGGFGTTAAGLRSGVPSIVIPHIIDQYYWGQQVFELGVGPKFFTRAQLTAAKLAQSITHAIHNTEMRRKAAELGAAIRGDPDGVIEAVRLIGEMV